MVITRGFGNKKRVDYKKSVEKIVEYVIIAINQELEKRNWSQKKLTEKIGKNEAWVSRKIGKKVKEPRNLTVDDLHIIASGLDMFLTEFFPRRLDEEICDLPLATFIRIICRNEIKDYLEKNGIKT